MADPRSEPPAEAAPADLWYMALGQDGRALPGANGSLALEDDANGATLVVRPADAPPRRLPLTAPEAAVVRTVLAALVAAAAFVATYLAGESWDWVDGILDSTL